MRSLLPTVALVLVAGGLTGCDGPKLSGPDAGDAAHELASALTYGDFKDVELTGDETAQQVGTDYATVVEGMGDLSPKVTAGDVTEKGDSATATLTWAWPIAGKTWTYTTPVALTKAKDAWQVTWSRALVAPDLPEDAVLDLTPIAGERGQVLGDHGQVLVTNRPVVRFGIDRGKVPAAQAEQSARALASLVGIDPAAYAKQVAASGPKAFVEAITLRQEDVPTRVAQQYFKIPGGIAVDAHLPLGPTRGFAQPILGTVGEVTAEMIQKHPEQYQAGDVAGLSGLQARYDEQLQPVDGAIVHAESPDHTETELFTVEPRLGKPLELTLDQRLQTAAEDALARVRPASALVAIRPSDGAILAAANGPGTKGFNLATYGQSAPGSTFKTVSSLALLRSGLTPSSVVPCTSRVVVDGKVFENYDDYPSGGLGRIPLRTAVANSCNTAFISQAGRVGQGDLAGAAASLGIGIDHDLGFPAYFGVVPDPASQTEAAADLIGQGGILASPMTMATVMASIESGKTVVPRLVRSVPVSVPAGVAPLTAAEARALRGMLRGVVTSGSGRGLLDVPGKPVIAKTGTAEFVRNGKKLTHAWMVAAQGDLAVAVYVDVGASGSGTAGPVLEQFLRTRNLGG